MEFEHTPESLATVSIELLCQDGHHCDVYLRPLAFKSDEMIGVKLHGLQDEISIVAIPARGKISGAYANPAFIKTDAIRAGFDKALVLNQDGHVSEGSAMNIFMLKDGLLVTPPVTDNILEGITRRTVIELARTELDLEVVERPIDRTEVYLCDEFFYDRDSSAGDCSHAGRLSPDRVR